MKTLLRVTRENIGDSTAIYLFYAPDGAKSARTIEITEAVAVDVDAAGETIGVELISPRTSDLEELMKVARERDLSLDGLFAFA